MQLAGLLDENFKAGAGSCSIGQKINQTLSTQVLEASWHNDQILEAYLNLVPFRGELVGIDSLSRTLFDKAAQGLEEREAAVAAAQVRAPNAKAAQVASQACAVLRLMQAKADCDSLDLFTTGVLQRKAFDASEGFAPHLARRLISVRPELVEGSPRSKASTSSARTKIQSTVRAPLQRFAVQTLQQHLREL